MSRPVVVSAVVAAPLLPDAGLHHWLGIWKSPTNIPVSVPVSTRVNPAAPSPESVTAAPVKVLIRVCRRSY